jgi:hypothetical protein
LISGNQRQEKALAGFHWAIQWKSPNMFARFNALYPNLALPRGAGIADPCNPEPGATAPAINTNNRSSAQRNRYSYQARASRRDVCGARPDLKKIPMDIHSPNPHGEIDGDCLRTVCHVSPSGSWLDFRTLRKLFHAEATNPASFVVSFQRSTNWEGEACNPSNYSREIRSAVCKFHVEQCYFGIH